MHLPFDLHECDPGSRFQRDSRPGRDDRTGEPGLGDAGDGGQCRRGAGELIRALISSRIIVAAGPLIVRIYGSTPSPLLQHFRDRLE